MTDARHILLTRYAWLSVVAAVVTIGLKAGAYFLTGSVGLLSDALESLVNLVAAIAALIALSVAEQAPDEDMPSGITRPSISPAVWKDSSSSSPPAGSSSPPSPASGFPPRWSKSGSASRSRSWRH